MQTLSQNPTTSPSTLAHVSRAISHHSFLDPADWALGLSELATLRDEEIEAIAPDDEHDYPPAALDKVSTRFLVSQRRRFGISKRQALTDRLQFHWCVAEAAIERLDRAWGIG